MAINAYYFIGNMDQEYTKVYDGTKLQANAESYEGYLENDTLVKSITKGNITHVNQYGTMVYDETLGKNKGTLDIHYDEGYPKVYRGTTDVTSEYNQTQVADFTFQDLTPGYKTFTIIARDVTLKSASLTKEYDGTALTAYSQAGGTDVQDLTAGQTDKGYVSGEEFTYTFTGSQLFEGSSDNEFTVSDSNTALTSDYNETLQFGTLTVTKRTVPVTITVEDQEWLYDGTTSSFSTSAYTVSGELAYSDTITVTLSCGDKVDAGTYANGITANYTIMHNNGDGTYTDVTDMYANVTVDAGDLTINKRSVTLTSGSATEVRDGEPLTNDTVTVSGDGFVGTEGATYNVTGSQTEIGSSANTFTYELKDNTKAGNYDITKVEGTLTVTGWEQLVTITADSNSQMYDGTTLTDTGYDIDGLAAGHTATVTVSGEITHAGTADNVVSSYTIYDENGQDVTAAYTNVQTVKGTLEVTKRDVTLTSATDTKPYDGTPLTNSNVAVSGDGFVGTEGATYTVTGSQTGVGTSKNTFSYVLNNGTDANDYSIHTVEGDLTVTPAELVITVGLDLSTGLTYLYDNTATKVLEAGEYQVSGLAQGDSVVNVTITTDSANAGIYDENAYTLTYDVVNAAGESTKASYIITENKNDIEITKRTITIEAGSDSKVYDGTALTCDDWTVTEGATEEYKLLAGETVTGVGFTADSTITHAGSTANKVDATNVTITKADGSDSSMNYNIETEDGTLTVTQRGVLLQSTSADKFYDGTALQNRQVVITGFHYDESGNVVIDSTDAGFLDGDGCTYDFVGDNVVIDADGNVIAWVVSEQSYTAYGQTDVGTSKNEFNYNNFTSVYAGSYESDYIIMNGSNQEQLGLSKDDQDLFGDLTVWGGPVDINMTDYSWTYDYQAKTNGYFDDGYTVVFTTDEAGTETETTEVAHNSEGSAIALFGSDTIVVTVTGEGGSAETGKVQHVGDNTQNEASYTIYRNGVDVTAEVEEYYQISIDGGELSITPRTVYITSASDSKEYDGEALTNYTVIEGSEGRDTGFIFGEGAAYEVTGSQTEVGASKNSFAISELLTDTQASDYNFIMKEGTLVVKGDDTAVRSTIAGDFKTYGCAFQLLENGQGLLRSAMTSDVVTGTLENVDNWKIVGTGNFNGNEDGKEGLLWQDLTTGELVIQNDMTSFAEVNNKTTVFGVVGDGFSANYTGDFSGNGKTGVLIETPEVGDITESTTRGLACFDTGSEGWFAGWLGALVNTWDDGVALKGDLSSLTSLNQDNYRYEVVAVGDFNGDGRDDVMLQNTMPTVVNQDGVDYTITGSGDVFTFLTGDEAAIKRGDNPTVCYAGRATDGWNILGVGDFDSDGDADVLLGKENEDGTTTLVGWQMKNGQQQEAFGLGTMAANQEFKGIADFNNDGTDDLLVSSSVAGVESLSAWTIKNATVTGSLAIV